MVVMPMIIMFFLGMVIVTLMVIIIIVMPVGIERATFTEIQSDQAVTFHEEYRRCPGGDAFNGLFQKSFQIMAHPEYKVGLLKLSGLRGFQCVGMRRPGALDNQVWRADALHHRGNQRMHRLDRGNDIYIRQRRCNTGQGDAGGNDGRGQKGGSDGRHGIPHEAETDCCDVML